MTATCPPGVFQTQHARMPHTNPSERASLALQPRALHELRLDGLRAGCLGAQEAQGLDQLRALRIERTALDVGPHPRTCGWICLKRDRKESDVLCTPPDLIQSNLRYFLGGRSADADLKQRGEHIPDMGISSKCKKWRLARSQKQLGCQRDVI